MLAIALVLPVVSHLGYFAFATQPQLGPGRIAPGQPQPSSDLMQPTAGVHPLSDGSQQKPDEVIPPKSVPGEKRTNETQTGREGQTQSGRECIDRGNNCDSLKKLCSSPLYKTDLEQNCALSCGVCGGVEKPANNGPASGECVDKGQNCNKNRALCRNKLYDEIMTHYCPLTCKFCAGSRPTSNNEAVRQQQKSKSNAIPRRQTSSSHRR
ncbi:repeat antigen 1 [Aphelenchoides avenae]|nr:repeat antigen 1 [Aphelenchus avenae]